MNKLRASALLLFGATPFAAPAQNTTLASLRDVARPVLIFGNGSDTRVAEQLLDLQSNADAAHERDIRVIQIPTPIAGPKDLKQLSFVRLSAQEQERVRKAFGIPSQAFTVVLVGKDGGEKLRSDKPIPWQTLVVTIDGMPMRKNEMKRH